MADLADNEMVIPTTYVNFVESDEFLRLTFYLIWTKDVTFAKKTKFGTQLAHCGNTFEPVLLAA